MSRTQTVPTPGAKAVGSGWVTLIGLSFLAFVVGAAVQFGLIMLMDSLYGACVQSTGPCPPGSEYTPWQEAIVTVPTYLIWIAPAIVAARTGKRLAAQGVAGGRALMIGGLALHPPGDDGRVPDVVDPGNLTRSSANDRDGTRCGGQVGRAPGCAAPGPVAQGVGC